jgi:hypothetical protein
VSGHLESLTPAVTDLVSLHRFPPLCRSSAQSSRLAAACAGNAFYSRARPQGKPVHPRMRGERYRWKTGTPSICGSSPHARGTLERPCAGHSLHLYNGSSPRPPAPTNMPVHPRMRGERCAKAVRHRLLPGSSPHARGTPLVWAAVALRNRFIPACAGNALHLENPLASAPVHPRMRGERGWPIVGADTPTSSSPHARGTRYGSRARYPVNRFIPACAWNAERRGTDRTCRTVHPRMRGERQFTKVEMATDVGSSPHARGTPRPSTHAGADWRFIPACAGNALQGKTLKRQTIYRVKQPYRRSCFVHCCH